MKTFSTSTQCWSSLLWKSWFSRKQLRWNSILDGTFSTNFLLYNLKKLHWILLHHLKSFQNNSELFLWTSLRFSIWNFFPIMMQLVHLLMHDGKIYSEVTSDLINVFSYAASGLEDDRLKWNCTSFASWTA